VVDSGTYGSWATDAPFEYLNSDEYLSQRFQLFDTYCFPSIVGQSNKNFTWLVLFNDRLPEKWRTKIHEYKSTCPNIEVRYLSEIPYEIQRQTYNRFISSELKKESIEPEFILTTRFDNDDAFHFSFVDSVQKYFLEHKKEMLINYINGLQYVPQYNVLKNITVIDGHFGTLAEKNDSNMRTVVTFSHSPLPADLPLVVNLKTKTRIWIETTHNSNAFNEPWFRPRHFIEDFFLMGFKYRNLNDFGIKQDIRRFNFYVWKVIFQYLVRKFKKKVTNKLTRN
jgi:hypothetical protein